MAFKAGGLSKQCCEQMLYRDVLVSGISERFELRCSEEASSSLESISIRRLHRALRGVLIFVGETPAPRVPGFPPPRR